MRCVPHRSSGHGLRQAGLVNLSLVEDGRPIVDLTRGEEGRLARGHVCEFTVATLSSSVPRTGDFKLVINPESISSLRPAPDPSEMNNVRHRAVVYDEIRRDLATNLYLQLRERGTTPSRSGWRR